MRQIICSFLLIYTSQILAAPTCGTNKSLSLFSPGRSLAGTAITDQDGMYTCGSNTLSNVIKSALKTSKDLSYMDVAFQAAKPNWGTKNNPTKQFMAEKERMAFEGMEDLCASLDNIKGQGGLCPRENFSFESTVYSKWGGEDYGQKQMELMLTLSKYLDVQNVSFGMKNPEAKKKEIEKILKYIQDKKLTYADKCKANGDGKDGVDFHDTLGSLMGSLMLWISNNEADPKQKACVDASIKYFNAFNTTPYTGKDSHPLDIRPQIMQKLKASFNYDVLFNQWKKGINPPGDKFSLPLARFMDRNSEEKNLFKLCNLKAEDSVHPLSGKQLYQPSLTKSVYKELNSALDSKECEKSQLAAWLKSSKASKEVEALCPGYQGTRELMGALSVLPLWENNLSQILGKIIPETQATFDNLTNILAPDCAKNRLSVAHLNCEAHSAYNRLRPLPLEELREQFREASLRQLDKGNALAIGMCEHFLRGDSSLTHDSCEMANGGYHAVTVSGYRCVKGVMEYEITNSWGKNCPLKSGSKDKVIDCVLDEDGWPTGRFWVKEDNLLKNVDKYYEISP